MGVYVYTVTRKARKISGRKIHSAEFAFTCGGSMIDEHGRTRDERLSMKIVAPRERAWKKAELNGESIKDALFVEDYLDGANVLRRSSVAFYDTMEFGEHVGNIRQSGESSRFVYVPLKPRSFKVTFKGTKIYDHTNGVPVRFNPDRTTYVTAINALRAKCAADKFFFEDKTIGMMEYTTIDAEIVEEEKPMTHFAALNLAMEALRKSDAPLSQRVEARNILKEIIVLPELKNDLI